MRSKLTSEEFCKTVEDTSLGGQTPCSVDDVVDAVTLDDCRREEWDRRNENFLFFFMKKRPELLRDKPWVIHSNNMPAHFALFVKRFLTKYSIPVLEHPFYSLDLGPCDFYLFPKEERGKPLPLKNSSWPNGSPSLDDSSLVSTSEPFVNQLLPEAIQGVHKNSAKILHSQISRWEYQYILQREPACLLYSVREIDHYKTGSLMVGGRITLDSRTHSFVFARDTVTAVRHRDEVLELCVRLLTGAVGPDFILMDGNARHIKLIWLTNFWKVIKLTS
ncbi:putative mariner transposase [Trichonephila clavipes]|nr:putative mariner transposase [Trichonephila clavipes]